MNVELFEYEMKKAGYKTPEKRAEVLGLSRSAYYRRINHKCECSEKEMRVVAKLFGWEVMRAIFFD